MPLIFPTEIQGIPCLCQVLDYQPPVPMCITGMGFGDAEPPEHEYLDFQLLDKHGEISTRLQGLVTPSDETRLLEEVKILFIAQEPELAEPSWHASF